MRDWTVLRWREKTARERWATCASFGMALAVLGVGIWTANALAADYAARADRINRCLTLGDCRG